MFFIAELCQNHNGNFDQVLKMVDAAASAGATHVKIQHIYADNLSFRPQFENGLKVDNRILSIKRPWQIEYDRLKSLELTSSQCSQFVAYAEELGLIPMTTCFARSSISEILQQGFKTVKVASYDCSSYQMLRELCASFDSIYVSTGATFDSELKTAVKILKEHANDYSLLHCVTEYLHLPKLNLSRIKFLQTSSRLVGLRSFVSIQRWSYCSQSSNLLRCIFY